MKNLPRTLLWILAVTILPALAYAQQFETYNDNVGYVSALGMAGGSEGFGSYGQSGSCTTTTTPGVTVQGAPTYLQPYGNFRVTYSLSYSTLGPFGGNFKIACGGSGGIVFGVYITGTYAPASIFYPVYRVTSIIYAPPGNRSSNGFTNSTTDGTTTTVGNSFTAGSTITYTSGGDFLGLGGTLSLSFGASATKGNSKAFTETFTDASGVSLASQSTNPNAISHAQDLFLIWLNPAISFSATGTTTANYSVGTQSSANGAPEEMDIVEVSAITMEANSSGVTTVPGAILGPQDDASGNPTLPGLALVCANHAAYYPNCTTANQCGCGPSDFAPILALDPLLNYTTTESPLNADASGATACANPTSTDKCRYVPVPSAPGSSLQEVELLQGPECQGCDFINNTFTQTDQNTTTQTLTESSSQTVGYSWKADLADETGGPTLTSTTQFTWTEMESTGEINGTANSAMVTLSSATVDCSEEIPVFEDTVFHTFVFQQPSNNTSCP